MPIQADANGQVLIPIGNPVTWNFAATVRVGRGTLNVDPSTVDDFETSWTANLGGVAFQGGSDARFHGNVYTYHCNSSGLFVNLPQETDPMWVLSVSASAQAYVVIDPNTGAVSGYTQRAVGIISVGINGTVTSFPALAPGTTIPFNVLPSIEFFSAADWNVSVQACGPGTVPTIGVMPLTVISDAMYGHEAFVSTSDGRSGHRSVTTWDSSGAYGVNPAATGWTALFANRFDAVGGLQVSASGSDASCPWPSGALLCYGVSNPQLSLSVREWPGGQPIAAMPTQAFNGGNLQTVIGTWQEFSRPSVPTDSDGNAPAQAFYSRTRGAYDGVLSSAYIQAGAWNQSARLEAYAADSYNWIIGSPSWLQANNYDPRTAGYDGGNGFSVYGAGLDVDALIDFYAWPTLITVTRQSSFTFENGQGAARWQGVTLPGDVYSTPVVDPAWQITQQLSGIQALYPPPDPAASGITYGLQQTISSAGFRRAWRNYRYCQIKIAASAPCKVRFVLQTSKDVLTDALGQPLSWPTVTEYWDHIALVAGDNTVTLDLAQGIPQPPSGGTLPRVNGCWDAPSIQLGDAHAGIGGSSNSTGVFDGLGECVLRSYTTPIAQDPNNRWSRNDVQFVRIDKLTPGITYTLESIVLLDRTDGDRTPLRVLGDPGPNRSSAEIPEQTLPPRTLLRVLTNGRPAVVFPIPVPETPPGGAQVIPAAADLAARLIDYFDEGGNVWSVTATDTALAAAIPAAMLQVVPGSITDTGFALAPVARTVPPDRITGASTQGGLTVLPWFEAMITETPAASWNLGGVIEGIVLDASQRTATSGAQVAGTITNPVQAVGSLTPITTPEGPVATDDDGYFALPLHQPVYAGPPNIFGKPTVTTVNHTVDDVADPDMAKVLATAGHRNSLFLYVLANPALQALETDMAQDYVSGRIYFVYADPDGNLSCDAYEGYTGLFGLPARSENIVDAVTGLPRAGIAPSLWIVSEIGLASLVYQRPDGAVVMTYSSDGLISLGVETMALFSRMNGLPHHYRDSATGIAYVFAAFASASGASSADVLLIRLDASNNLLTWADGTTEKTVLTSVSAAGRPDALPNRVDGAHTILLLYGDLRYQSADGGENWTAIE